MSICCKQKLMLIKLTRSNISGPSHLSLFCWLVCYFSKNNFLLLCSHQSLASVALTNMLTYLLFIACHHRWRCRGQSRWKDYIQEHKWCWRMVSHTDGSITNTSGNILLIHIVIKWHHSHGATCKDSLLCKSFFPFNMFIWCFYMLKYLREISTQHHGWAFLP